MRFFPIVLVASLLLALPAAAQPRVTIDDVRNIAFSRGIVVIKDVDLDDGVWEVVGFDPTGAKIKMKVDAWSGAIIKLKRKD
jgi:hypothetical protein